MANLTASRSGFFTVQMSDLDRLYKEIRDETGTNGKHAVRETQDDTGTKARSGGRGGGGGGAGSSKGGAGASQQSPREKRLALLWKVGGKPREAEADRVAEHSQATRRRIKALQVFTHRNPASGKVLHTRRRPVPIVTSRSAAFGRTAPRFLLGPIAAPFSRSAGSSPVNKPRGQSRTLPARISAKLQRESVRRRKAAALTKKELQSLPGAGEGLDFDGVLRRRGIFTASSLRRLGSFSSVSQRDESSVSHGQDGEHSQLAGDEDGEDLSWARIDRRQAKKTSPRRRSVGDVRGRGGIRRSRSSHARILRAGSGLGGGAYGVKRALERGSLKRPDHAKDQKPTRKEGKKAERGGTASKERSRESSLVQVADQKAGDDGADDEGQFDLEEADALEQVLEEQSPRDRFNSVDAVLNSPRMRGLYARLTHRLVASGAHGDALLLRTRSDPLTPPATRKSARSTWSPGQLPPISMEPESPQSPQSPGSGYILHSPRFQNAYQKLTHRLIASGVGSDMALTPPPKPDSAFDKKEDADHLRTPTRKESYPWGGKENMGKNADGGATAEAGVVRTVSLSLKDGTVSVHEDSSEQHGGDDDMVIRSGAEADAAEELDIESDDDEDHIHGRIKQGMSTADVEKLILDMPSPRQPTRKRVIP